MTAAAAWSAVLLSLPAPLHCMACVTATACPAQLMYDLYHYDQFIFCTTAATACLVPLRPRLALCRGRHCVFAPISCFPATAATTCPVPSAALQRKLCKEEVTPPPPRFNPPPFAPS